MVGIVTHPGTLPDDGCRGAQLASSKHILWKSTSIARWSINDCLCPIVSAVETGADILLSAYVTNEACYVIFLRFGPCLCEPDFRAR